MPKSKKLSKKTKKLSKKTKKLSKKIIQKNYSKIKKIIQKGGNGNHGLKSIFKKSQINTIRKSDKLYYKLNNRNKEILAEIKTLNLDPVKNQKKITGLQNEFNKNGDTILEILDFFRTVIREVKQVKEMSKIL